MIFINENGSLPVFWKESDIGIQQALCPCGNVSESLNLTITRVCRGDFISQAEWESPNNSACSGLNFRICNISEVSLCGTLGSRLYQKSLNIRKILLTFSCQ